MHGGGVLSVLEHNGAFTRDGIGKYELFALVGEIFCFDASDGAFKWNLCADLVHIGAIFI